MWRNDFGAVWRTNDVRTRVLIRLSSREVVVVGDTTLPGDDRYIEIVVDDHGRDEPDAAQHIHGGFGLIRRALGQKPSARTQPLGAANDDSSQHVESVMTTIERGTWFVQSCLGRQVLRFE